MCRKLARFQRSDRGVQRCSTFMAFEAHVERAERSAKRHDRSGNVTRRCGPACKILLPESRCLLLLVPLPLLLKLLVRLFAARRSFTRGLDESILFARRGLKKQKSPKKHERPAKPAR